MAKKKMTCRKDNYATKSTDHHNPQEPPHRQHPRNSDNHQHVSKPHGNGAAMEEDALEKLSNLKSLNAMLLKETVERRQEVKCLLEYKKTMESELTRVFSEIEGLKSQFTRMTEGNLSSYLEKDVLSTFIESQLRGMADEVEALKVEMSEIVAENRTIMERYEGLVREKAEIEKKLEDMEREMMEVVRDRNEMEMAKLDGDSEIGSLKRSVNLLQGVIKKEKETVIRLTRERDGLKGDLGAWAEETGKLKEKLTEMEITETKRTEEIEAAAGVIDGLKTQIEERDREKKALLECEKLTRISEPEKDAGVMKAGATRKGFWTLVVSSATTMVAVVMVSVAYSSSTKGP